jgi:hypothetical protein
MGCSIAFFMSVGLAACRGNTRQRSGATRYGVFLVSSYEGTVAKEH